MLPFSPLHLALLLFPFHDSRDKKLYTTKAMLGRSKSCLALSEKAMSRLNLRTADPDLVGVVCVNKAFEVLALLNYDAKGSTAFAR